MHMCVDRARLLTHSQTTFLSKKINVYRIADVQMQPTIAVYFSVSFSLCLTFSFIEFLPRCLIYCLMIAIKCLKGKKKNTKNQ